MNSQFNFLIFLSFSLLASFAGFSQSKVWTLNECISHALTENIQVQQAALGNKQAELSLERSKASRMPSAQASISQNFNWGKSFDQTTGKYGSFEGSNGTNYSLSSNVTLFNGFKIKNQIKQSELDLKGNQYYSDVVKESVELSILDAFLQILYAKENVENANKQIEATQEQLQLAEERLRLSVISQADYLQIKSELASEKATLTDAESQLLIAKVNLMQLMEIPATTDFEVALPNLDDMLNEKREPSAEQIYQEALTLKPQIKQAELSEQSASLNEKIAFADLMPSLSMNAGIGTNYSNSMSNYSYTQGLSNQVSPYVGFTLSIPIYQKKQVITNIGIAKIGVEEAVLSTQNTKNSLRKVVEQAVANVFIAQQQYEASKEEYSVAQSSMGLAKEKYEQGLINSVDFLFEKTSLIITESSLLKNKYNLIFSYKVLDFYKGVDLKFL